MLEEDGTRGVLVISPALYWWDRYQWDDLHMLIAGFGEEAGLEVLDPPRQGDPEPLRFPGDNLHYTPEGADWLAGHIAGHISREGSPTPAP